MDRGAWRATVHRVTKSQNTTQRLSTSTAPHVCVGQELLSSSYSLLCLLGKNDYSEMLRQSCGIHSESRIGEYFSIILSHKKSFSIILFVYFPSSKLVCSFFFFFSLILIGFQLTTFPFLHDHSEFGTLYLKAEEKSFGLRVLITRLVFSHSSY